MNEPDELEYELVGTVTVFHLVGDVDASNADELAATLSSSCAATRRVALDLSATTYLDSAGIRLIDTVGRSCGPRGVPSRRSFPRTGRVPGCGAPPCRHSNSSRTYTSGIRPHRGGCVDADRANTRDRGGDDHGRDRGPVAAAQSGGSGGTSTDKTFTVVNYNILHGIFCPSGADSCRAWTGSRCSSASSRMKVPAGRRTARGERPARRG